MYVVHWLVQTLNTAAVSVPLSNLACMVVWLYGYSLASALSIGLWKRAREQPQTAIGNNAYREKSVVVFSVAPASSIDRRSMMSQS